MKKGLALWSFAYAYYSSLVLASKQKSSTKKFIYKRNKLSTIETKTSKKFAQNPALILSIFFLFLSIFLFLSSDEQTSKEDTNLQKIKVLQWASGSIPECLNGQKKGFYFIEYQDSSLEGYYDESDFYSLEPTIDDEIINCFSIPTPSHIQELKL